MNLSSTKIAIVTGATSGIGEATATLLANKGYKVFGASRRGANGQNARTFEMLALDVTDDQSVEALVSEVIRRAGRIDLLVNNAGFGLIGGAEESSMEQAHAIFNTNVYGCIRMIKAVLPHMRNQGAGRIVNVSSVLGKIPSPYMALYAATKHALEGYSETLDHEVRNFNIHSVLVEPGITKTNFEQNTTIADATLPIYDKHRNGLIQYFKDSMDKADTPQLVAKCILKAATAKKPRLRYTAGAQAGLVTKLRRFAPERMVDSAIRKSFQIDAV